MFKKVFALIVVLFLSFPAIADEYYRVFSVESGTELLGAAGASAFNHAFKTVIIAADPNNLGSVCIGTSGSVTCSDSLATLATDGLKLEKGDAVTIGNGSFASGLLYLNNTQANDTVNYFILE